MPVPRISLLSSEEKERIHSQSLDILQKVGIQFNARSESPRGGRLPCGL